MANYNNLPDLFGDIADAIREKDGSSQEIMTVDFPQKILDIPGGGEIPQWTGENMHDIQIPKVYYNQLLQYAQTIEVIYV